MYASPLRGAGRELGEGDHFGGNYFPWQVVEKWKCRGGKVRKKSVLVKRWKKASFICCPLTCPVEDSPVLPGSPISRRHQQDPEGQEDSCG